MPHTIHRIAALSTIALLALPLAAAAQTQRVEVQTGDLNLATGSGRAVLEHRIASAANAVCGAYDGLAKVKAYAACTATARAGAKPQAEAMIAAARDARFASMRHDMPSAP